MLRVLGIDLAVQPASTGTVLLEPNGAGCWVARELDGPADDDRLVAAARQVDVIGIDSPLGWPSRFVEAVSAHASNGPWPGADQAALTHRDTDRSVRQITGRLALSVSADKLGATAMRCARLQHRWATEVWGQAAPRDGSGALVEVYPRVAMSLWRIDTHGYKGGSGPKAAAGRAARTTIVDQIAAASAPWLDLEPVVQRCVASDHVLDGLVCGLVAIAAKAGATTPSNDPNVANSEGWIHLPTCPLPALQPPTTLMH